MKAPGLQSGFSLITAIFLLVVVAALVVYVSNIRVTQQTTLVYGVQGARAMQAARSGLQWGIHRAINGGLCAASSSFTIPASALDDFNVEVRCSATTHFESSTLITTYDLISIADTASYGSLDYVQRRIRAKVSVDPP